MRSRVAVPCFRGEKRIALAVSEASAGSDVANISTTAVEDGDDYIVNGIIRICDLLSGGLCYF